MGVFPAFAAWAATYGKTYNGDAAVAAEAAYNANVALYEKLNAEQTDMIYGVNQFSDMTPEEFAAPLNSADMFQRLSAVLPTLACTSTRAKNWQPVSTGQPRVP